MNITTSFWRLETRQQQNLCMTYQTLQKSLAEDGEQGMHHFAPIRTVLPHQMVGTIEQGAQDASMTFHW